jgi:hypothetical protein
MLAYIVAFFHMYKDHVLHAYAANSILEQCWVALPIHAWHGSTGYMHALMHSEPAYVRVEIEKEGVHASPELPGDESYRTGRTRERGSVDRS